MNFDELKLQWLALESWKKLVIILVFTGAIIYLIYMFKLEPILLEKEKLSKEVSQLKSEISYLKKRATPGKIIEIENKIKEIHKDIETKKSELKILKTIIPDKAEVDKILKFIASNIYTSNLTLDKFNISKEETVYVSFNKENKTLSIRSSKRKKAKRQKRENEVQLKRLTVNIQATGSPRKLLKYIKNLSKSKRLLIIDDVKLKTQKEGVKIDMNISTFYSQEMKK